MKYWLYPAAALLASILISWMPVSTNLDNALYDWMCRLFPIVRTEPQAVVIAIDETTLQKNGGMRALRSVLAQTLEQIATIRTSAVAIDFTLADAGDAQEDRRLAQAMAQINHLVLATDIAQDGSGWQDPIPAFSQSASALGHVHANPDPVCREISLSKVAGRTRRWAMALEALSPGTIPLESGNTVNWNGRMIPATDVRIAFSEELPRMSASQLDLAKLEGKTIFIGATPLTAARDRLMTPLGIMMPGVEIHAQLYETFREGRFRTDLSLTSVLAIMLLIAASTVAAIRWAGYAAGAAVILLAHALPFVLFRNDLIVPGSGIALAAWLPGLTAATLQYRATRMNLARAETDRSRYQQAIHWVTHEMRSPLTAIQGSSELMTRYSLPADKQKQIADMIHSESKRLAQMIQSFLDVERLSSGQIELKQADFSMSDVLRTCSLRVAALLEQKQQTLLTDSGDEITLRGDRELMEFALYNLLTNAVKYSPEETEIQLSASQAKGTYRFSVKDQGMGIAQKDLSKLGNRFFRTRHAEDSGIQGTGIGLSIVREIVSQHGGKLEVASKLGEGSCFTIVLPVQSDTVAREV